MSKVVRQIGFDEGAYVAREKEDVVVGNEFIRHRLSSRVIHWAVAGTFNSMTRGTVSKAWARIHHPKWYRELMGLEK